MFNHDAAFRQCTIGTPGFFTQRLAGRLLEERLTTHVPFLQALIATVSQSFGGGGKTHTTAFEELEVALTPASLSRTKHLLAGTINDELRFESLSSLFAAEAAALFFFRTCYGGFTNVHDDNFELAVAFPQFFLAGQVKFAGLNQGVFDPLKGALTRRF